MRKNHIILIVFLLISSVIFSSCAANRSSGYHGTNRVQNKPPKEWKKPKTKYPEAKRKL
jgi:uncharacterized lipoprotein YajG